MRLDSEPKLNFEDVLLKPKRSTLSSRKDVDMTRKFTFRNSGKVMDFLPIFASNMDGVGTFSMAKAMQEHKMMTVITKTTTPEQWKQAVCPYAQEQTKFLIKMHRIIKICKTY